MFIGTLKHSKDFEVKASGDRLMIVIGIGMELSPTVWRLTDKSIEHGGKMRLGLKSRRERHLDKRKPGFKKQLLRPFNSSAQKLPITRKTGE